MTAAVNEGPAPAGSKDLFGHPRGLGVLGATELWERISFHGMQALLVLYMVGQLFQPGHIESIVGFATFRAMIEGVTGPLSVQALATQIFGLYVGLVYFTPVLGGALGDRWLGRTRTVILGGLLMTAGHFCMAFDQTFLLAMLLLILGAGCLRGNLTPQVGELYSKEDSRRVVGFQLYAAAINLGAFIAPLASGALGAAYGWHIGFGFAGFGMLLGLVIYVLGRRDLPPEPPRGPRTAAEPMTARERRTVWLLVGLVPVAALFWIAQSQVWNTYNLWVRDHIDLTFGGWTMPVPWLQSLDGLAPFVCLPPMLAFWRWQAARGREPHEFSKIAVGCFIFAASTLILVAAGLVSGADGRAPLLLAVVFHFASNLGWLYFVPTILALFSRAAPGPVNATMVGVYYSSVFFGSLISGRMGGLYETLDPAAFWTLHAALVGLCGVIMAVIGWRFRGAYLPEPAAAASLDRAA